jgi:hypothetical protein
VSPPFVALLATAALSLDAAPPKEARPVLAARLLSGLAVLRPTLPLPLLIMPLLPDSKSRPLPRSWWARSRRSVEGEPRDNPYPLRSEDSDSRASVVLAISLVMRSVADSDASKSRLMSLPDGLRAEI